MNTDTLNNPIKFFEYLEKNQDFDAAEAENVVKTIIPSLREVINVERQQISRLATLNLAFRVYNKLISKHTIFDESIKLFVEEKINQNNFEVLYALLQTEGGKSFDAKYLLKKSLSGLNECPVKNETDILIILRALNLLLKRNSTLKPYVHLCQIYSYLQMNQNGLREEVLIFFNHCCQSYEQAQKYFQFIIEYYPWTNRNKYFLLSCILNSHNVDDLLKDTNDLVKNFFKGLRMSLGYKRLLPSSQYLIKALSNQKSLDLLKLSANILTHGTFKEISNFHAHWFNRIKQQDSLFKLLFIQEISEIINTLENFTTHKNPTEEYRFILIFSMFSRQILNFSKLDFFKISTELITNCFKYEVESQLLIYKFIVDNMNCFALEDSLEFLAVFIIHHKNIENAQMRNNILAKISTIINYISKDFRKIRKKQVKSCDLNTLNESICDFFIKLNELILQNIENDVYQPKIFSLKLLDVLLKSLFQENLEKNAKNCIVMENKELGAFLIAEGVFKANETILSLTKALNDPTGFDDALDLIVLVLKRLENVDFKFMFETCKNCCENVDIDLCALSSRYAAVILNINRENYKILSTDVLDKLSMELAFFKNDPLNTCKTRCHIFGYLNVLNLALTNAGDYIENTKYEEILQILENILNLILEFLKSTNSSNVEFAPIAASFQDMDESLEFLVKNSSFKTENNEECRKFLLMSFWLTLKACCDMATTLAFVLTPHDKEVVEFERLQRCLNINVAVLTRCRHKGAIEAAGLSIGKLTKHITSHKFSLPKINQILYESLSLLFSTENLVSTTRRGAGFSIMFLHIIKNDEQIDKPLLKYAMTKIFKLLENQTNESTENIINNFDRIETLCLHYLCVLSKDAELRDVIAEYRNLIILAAIKKIDDPDWTVCNAALQLFGALVPKIVGQKQATDFEAESDWESNDVCFLEIAKNMPEFFEYILDYCTQNSNNSRSTRSIILFLGFLSKLEHLAQDDKSQVHENLMFRLRELLWNNCLKHVNEKVRKLAALCFVRAHEFHYELPEILLLISNLLFLVQNENFFEGLIFVLQAGVLKIQNEAVNTFSSTQLDEFLKTLQYNLSKNFINLDFKFYTQLKLLEMFLNIGFNSENDIVKRLVQSLQITAKKSKFGIKYDDIIKKDSYLIKNGYRIGVEVQIIDENKS